MSLQAPPWLTVAHLALLSRQMDALEVEQLTPQGKIKYQFSAGGHELTQILLAQALDHAHDAAAVYYRARPFALACGMSAAEALLSGMARAGGLSEGRDVGVMFNLPRRKGALILPTSGDVGAQYTPAAGWAQAIRYRSQTLGETEWGGALAAALGGEGSVATNGFWAALNIVTVERLPYLFFVEDNLFGLSVPSQLQTPGGNIAANLAGYPDLLTLEVDGCDPVCTWETICQAVEYVRSTGPCLLRLRVPRLAGHTFIDDQAYKSAAVRADDAARDPLPCLKAYLAAQGIASDQDWQALEKEVAAELAAALEIAEAAVQPDAGQVIRHRFFEGSAPQQGGLRAETQLIPLGLSIPEPSGGRINLVDAVRRTLEAEMECNPRLLIFGEDVGVKGGVHGATLDLQIRFGAARVFDTSLNEEGIIGRSAGMALAGLLPVPEIQFRKYADPAHEQLDDIGWIRWRTANHFAAPLVVRIPVGFGKKTGDPWHSVTNEAAYAHLVGWRIAFPSNAEDAVGLLRTALRGDDPTFFFEHRALLDTAEGRRPYPGDEYCLPFGQAARLTEGSDLTLVTWGAMTPRCLEAGRAFPGQIDLLDLRTIAPWDHEAVLASLDRTGKLLIVHEDTLTAGFGAEIAATAAAEAFTALDAPVERLAVPDIPIPYNLALMEAVVPGVEQIRERLKRLLAY